MWIVCRQLHSNNNVKTILLPASFWEIEKLRHVEITEAEFDLEEDKQGSLKDPLDWKI